jgi:ketosteroid isomerase-like protein
MDSPNGRIEDDGKYVVVWRKTGKGWQVAADIFNSSRQRQ